MPNEGATARTIEQQPVTVGQAIAKSFLP